MPVFNLACTKCLTKYRRLLPDLSKEQICPATVIGEGPCNGVLARDGEGPTSRIVEVRDNGLMPKKVEQLANIDDLIRNR